MMVEPECFIRRKFISWILLVGLIQEVSAKNIVVFVGTLNDKDAAAGATIHMRLGSSKGFTNGIELNHNGDDFRIGETDGYSYTYSDAELAYPITQVEFCGANFLHAIPGPHWGISDVEIVDKDQGQWFLFHFNNYLSNTLYIGSGPAEACRTASVSQSSTTPSPLEWTITTTTGGSSGSDTGSKISIIMFGRNSTKTRTHTLRNMPVGATAFKKDFELGQTSQFTIRTIFIEPITRVRVCTDCFGIRPKWRNKEFTIQSPKIFGLRRHLIRPSIRWRFSSPKEFDCNNLCHDYEVLFCGSDVYQEPKVHIFNLGESYTFVCIPQMGIDKQANMSIGIRNVIQKDTNGYRANAMTTWSRLYSYSTKKTVAEQGPKPDTVQVTSVTTGYDLDQGGNFGTIKFRIGPGIGRLDQRQISCGSTTTQKLQIDYGFHQSPCPMTYINIHVQFLPFKPNLTILWQAGAPFIFAGGQLKVKCDAFLGTLVSYSPCIRWHIESRSGKNKTWETRKYQNGIIENGVAVSGFPGAKKCQSGATLNDGRCLLFVKDIALNYKEAKAYCKRYIGSQLLQIENAKEFMYFSGKVGLDGFWIDLNDRLQEGVFKWSDGRSANITNWGYFYKPTKNDAPFIENSEENDCVILRKGGLQTLTCDQRMPFICGSYADFIRTPRNFDPDFGPKWSSILTIDVTNKDLLDGSTIRCEVEKPRRASPATPALNKLGISHFSNRSDVLKYLYRPLRPTIVDTSLKQSDSIKVELQCSSIVAMDDGAITWTMKQTDGVERTWILGDNPVEKNPHKFIDVVLLNDTKDADSGRFMSTNMTIEFNAIFQMSELSCYSYNKELPWVETSNVYGPEDLKDVYLMDFSTLKGVSLWEIEDIYGDISAKSSKSTNKLEAPARRSFVMYFLLAFLILATLGLFLMRKSDERIAVAKNESETRAETRGEH